MIPPQMIGTVLKIGMPVLILVGIFSWYQINQAKILTLESNLKIEKNNNAVLEENSLKKDGFIEKQKELLLSAKRDSAVLRESYKTLIKLNDQIALKVSKLNVKFNKRTEIVDSKGKKKIKIRNFGSLARKKPKAIQRIINKASKVAMRCMELASGAFPNDKDKKLCPDLFSNI